MPPTICFDGVDRPGNRYQNSRLVSAGVDGTVWGLSLTPSVIQTIDTWYESHTLIPLPGLDRPFNQISVTDLNRVWAIDDIGGVISLGGNRMATF
jgi:streptogramin lyase